MVIGLDTDRNKRIFGRCVGVFHYPRFLSLYRDFRRPVTRPGIFLDNASSADHTSFPDRNVVKDACAHSDRNAFADPAMPGNMHSRIDSGEIANAGVVPKGGAAVDRYPKSKFGERGEDNPWLYIEQPFPRTAVEAMLATGCAREKNCSLDNPTLCEKARIRPFWRRAAPPREQALKGTV